MFEKYNDAEQLSCKNVLDGRYVSKSDDGKILTMIQDMNYSNYSESMLRIQQEADVDREL